MKQVKNSNVFIILQIQVFLRNVDMTLVWYLLKNWFKAFFFFRTVYE